MPPVKGSIHCPCLLEKADLFSFVEWSTMVDGQQNQIILNFTLQKEKKEEQ
jgi:hypothetical protein